MIEQIINHLNIFVWAKDKNYKYLYCNEYFAEAAGVDSPAAIVGKSDHELYWKKYSDHYEVGDYGVMQGIPLVNVPDVIETVNNIKDILVSKKPLHNTSKEVIGVAGSFIDITGKHIIKKTGYYDANYKRYYLGQECFGDTYLTAQEIIVFKHILIGYTAREIGVKIKISAKTVESYIQNIKVKLQAKNKGEIIATAIHFGLTHILYLEDLSC